MSLLNGLNVLPWSSQYNPSWKRPSRTPVGLIWYWGPTAHISFALRGWYSTIEWRCPPGNFLHTEPQSAAATRLERFKRFELSTFMSETFEQRHVIQAQHLTDVDVICQHWEFLCGILEEKVPLSKGQWSEELEALLLSSSVAKQCLRRQRQQFWFRGRWCRDECLVCKQEEKEKEGKIPVPFLEICEQPCGS